jgi:hypothetical protein
MKTFKTPVNYADRAKRRRRRNEQENEIEAAGESWARSVSRRSWCRCPNGHGMLPVISAGGGVITLACRCRRAGGPLQLPPIRRPGGKVSPAF